MIKAALCIRPNWREQPGGDVVQLLKTKDALETNHPVSVSIVDSVEARELAESDIVHVFNVQQPEIGLPFLRAARARGQRTAISTIFWDLSHAHFAMVLNRFGLDACRFGFLKPLAGALFETLGRPSYFSRATRARVDEMVGLGDVLLPNSAEEAEMLARYLRTNTLSWNVRPVVNAVDAAVFCSSEVPWASRQGVIQAGNFEAVKNHMAVLRDDVPVVLVGNPTNRDYVKRIRKRAGGNVRIIDRSLPQADLAKEFHRCKVHVNPSFRESPGLSTMEALASGCRVVISDKPYCPVDTYFADLMGTAVFSCNPYSPASVRRAIDQALAAEGHVDLTEWLKKFSWDEAAKQTFAAYAEILSR